MSKINIAMDGPAGLGKSTLGKVLAQRIGYRFIDSGLFYRYFAKICWENKISHTEREKVIEFCSQKEKNIAQNPENFFRQLEKKRNELSPPEIGNLASQFAPIKELRLIIYQLIRNLVKNKGFVISGRDMTFEVLPKAEIKIFLTADLSSRAKRRYLQLQSEGKNLTLAEVEKDLQKRDWRDQENITAAEAASLKIDTTNLTFTEALEKLYNLYKNYNSPAGKIIKKFSKQHKNINMKAQKQKKSIVIVSKKILAERINDNLKRKKMPIDKYKIENVISELLEEIKNSLLKGENIRFPSYFSLHTITSKPRVAMNLHTEKKMNVPAKKVPKVKFSNTLKQEIAAKKK